MDIDSPVVGISCTTSQSGCCCDVVMKQMEGSSDDVTVWVTV